MEILDANCALLSNWEVSSHLKQQKDQRVLHDRKYKTTSKIQENLRTIEFEIAQYLQDPSLHGSNQLSAKQILAFLNHFKEVPLTKAEKLQIINLQPKSILELHLIVEECEERFDETQLNEILMAISVLFRRLEHQQPSSSSSSSRRDTGKGMVAQQKENSFPIDNFIPDMDDI